MEAKGRLRVMCVDDEPNVLEGLSLHLRRRYDVVTAPNGQAALEMIQSDRAVAVVISDMRMPGMDGAQFLSRSRQVRPEVVRMLLTGQTDMQAAISAVNDGQIFRFLTKPCPPASLLAAVDAAAEQHRLLTLEKVLLEQTLHGSIKILTDVLALTNPISFGRANRLKTRVSELAPSVNLTDTWQVEVAAMVSQLGVITLPPDVAEKVHRAMPLSEAEQKMVDRMPEATEQLLANVPRLEGVRAILARYLKPFRAGEALPDDAAKRTLELSSRLLRVALDFDVLEAQGSAPTRALDTLRGRTDRYDPQILEALAPFCAKQATSQQLRELPVAALRVGMVFAEDVKFSTGALLAARGYEVTSSFLERARNFRAGSVKEPIRVIVPPEVAAAAGAS
ncbi:MAG TPA: HD domain-containing phosphohydrolase [Polyangiaceae bacterium]